MSNQKSRRRSGFTLVELLVVIAIIGSLMAMTSVVIYRAIYTARSARVAVELDQLSQAMQTYKESQIQFPPSMSNISWTDRRTAFMRHVQLAFPNSAYGTSVANFDALRTKINLNTTPTNWNYNYVTNNSVQQLDLNTLDQAEALVFWLGGFPTPVNPGNKAPIAGRRLFGMHRDPDNPFKRDTLTLEAQEPLRYRTEPLFGFDETRLVDNDSDGWLEYSPLSPKSGAATAPFVYFDGLTYASSAGITTTAMKHFCYPRLSDTTSASSKAANLANQFGVAAPMALYLDPAGVNPTSWAKDTGFQIICGGLDGAYSSAASDLAKSQRVPIFPTGYVFDSGSNYKTQGYYAKQELDNLTNLSNKPLEAARSEAQQ
jgi:prepilin-type N-terminal cleavage/methylation domain-containing protein